MWYKRRATVDHEIIDECYIQLALSASASLVQGELNRLAIRYEESGGPAWAEGLLSTSDEDEDEDGEDINKTLAVSSAGNALAILQTKLGYVAGHFNHESTQSRHEASELLSLILSNSPRLIVLEQQDALSKGALEHTLAHIRRARDACNTGAITKCNATPPRVIVRYPSTSWHLMALIATLFALHFITQLALAIR